MICSNISVNRENHLCFAGMDVTKLAGEYKTPLYLYDEARIRENCRRYQQAMREYLPDGSRPLYAGKAACFQYIYQIMKQEEMWIDLVSAGEIYTAQKSGYPLEHSFFHGSSKSDWEIGFAIDSGVGYFVVDGMDELLALNAIAVEKNVVQKVLLRVTPGIDPHTYEAVATGKVDSKFGAPVENGQAETFVRAALSLPQISVQGYHCHVGSMVFDVDEDVYHDTAAIMLSFAADMKNKLGISVPLLNLGGGYAVRYVDSDPQIDIQENIRKLGVFIQAYAKELGIDAPSILMEPGRSIVADAGMTLYTVNAVKKIPGYKNYVAVDGGMTDNPRYALYGSQYTVYHAEKVREEANLHCDLVGRCCESGDIVQPGIDLPEPKRGDCIAVCTTGAYNFSMASGYNRVCRPAVVMLCDGESKLVVRREELEDIVRADI